MRKNEHGGNSVSLVNLGKKGAQTLGSGPYEYFIYESQEEEHICLNKLNSFSCFILQKPVDALIEVMGIHDTIQEGDCIQSEGINLEVKVQKGPVRLLVAGIKDGVMKDSFINHTSYIDLYKVEKPWGHELWINGQHEGYALKQIYIKSGTKTSLQYHNYKQETNVLFKGKAKLHYKGNVKVANDDVSDVDLSTTLLNPVSVIDVTPGVLHRLEAITDILLYETSTPHLDDVIRVSDDEGRLNGRIEKEHKS